MLHLRSRLDVAPLFAALGWLVACGPAKGETDSATGGAEACAGEFQQLMQGPQDAPTPSGLVRCDDGLIHRAEALECVVSTPTSTCPADANAGGDCLTDADCTERPFGACQASVNLGGGDDGTCYCAYGCRLDSDCPDGEICRCGGGELGSAPRCIPAGCTVDADCPGGLCSVGPGACSDGLIEAACTTPEDQCAAASDCEDTQCVFALDKWACDNSICGRPFVVDAAPVTAPAVVRDDWRTLVAAPAAAPDLRARLADHWTAIALAEHASIASFAGFVLQLLALGAPPALVGDAQRAMADEVEHARIGFALASLYQGTGVGPGALAVEGARVPGDVDAIVAAVIREACVAETLAGLELREAAARAEDPALARVLARIAGDEQRHAELGWRFVQWALSEAGADRRQAELGFAAALAEAEAAVKHMSQKPGDADLRGHGIVDAPLRAAVWRRGLDGLVRPAAARLCAA